LSAARRPGFRLQRGATLIELAIAIAIIGVAVVGVLSAFTVAARYNADPVIRKQALAIAEALLDEVLSRPYTSCDPDSYDPSSQTCSINGSVAEAMGPEPGETRTGASRFDNVNDYHGYSRPAGQPGDNDPSTGVEDVLGNRPVNWKPYSVSITVRAADGSANNPLLGPTAPVDLSVPSNAALIVTVTVTGPGPTVVQLDGVRASYDPTP
jgi:MSHA pilin protein MshD